MSLNIPVVQFDGLRPAFDRKQVGKPFVMEGENFLVDAQGPFSAFGSQVFSYSTLRNPSRIATFIVDDAMFLLDDDAVYVYNAVSQEWIPQVEFATGPEIDSPWYHAIVGGEHWFCRDGKSLIVYSPGTSQWEVVTTDVPVGAFAIAEADGRLIILGTSVVSWSAIGDGRDLTPSTTTGAGSQLLAKLGGTAQGLAAISGGFLVFTTNGILRAEVLDTITVFHFFNQGGREYALLNRFCLASYSQDSVVWLTRTGMFTSAGARIEEFQSEFSEHLRRDYFDVRRQFVLQETLMRLKYSSELDMFFISIADMEIPNTYSFAYVLYTPTNKWGSMNREHQAILTLVVDGVPELGYVDTDGYIHNFEEFPYVQSTDNAMSSDSFFAHSVVEYPSVHSTTSFDFVSRARLYTEDPTIFPQQSGLYVVADGVESLSPATIANTEIAGESITVIDMLIEPDITVDMAAVASETFIDMYDPPLELTFSTIARMQAVVQPVSVTVASPVFDPIGARVRVGMYRYTNEEFVDEISEIVRVNVGTLETPDGQTFVDMASVGPEQFVDMQNFTTDEFVDMGFAVFNTVDFTISVTGTIDGYTQWTEQTEELTQEFVEGRSRVYSCHNQGLYHWFDISALTDGQSFHLKSLDTSGNMAGRL